MIELQICMLGGFQLCWDYQRVPESSWPHPMAKNLLQLVLLHRPAPLPVAEAVRRLGSDTEIMDIPHLVNMIDGLLQPGASLQVGDGDLIFFHKGGRCWIDYDALMDHYRSGIESASRGELFPAILGLKEADALYQGDLLEEVDEPWVEHPRRELQQIYVDTLDRLAEGHSVLARYQDAVGYCHKALSHDPLREATYQRMMVYYYYMGNLSGAEEAFRVCTETLAEAGRRVDPATIELWEQLSKPQHLMAPIAQAAAAVQGPAPDPRIRRTLPKQ